MPDKFIGGASPSAAFGVPERLVLGATGGRRPLLSRPAAWARLTWEAGSPVPEAALNRAPPSTLPDSSPTANQFRGRASAVDRSIRKEDLILSQ